MSETPNNHVVNALSFDIEDWFHMVEIDAVADPRKWPELPSIVVEYTRWIVQTLAVADVKATFFILGWIVYLWNDSLAIFRKFPFDNF